MARRPGDYAIYLFPAGRWSASGSGVGRDYVWAGPHCPGVQGLESVWSMEYGAGIPYGNVLLTSEIEHCQYYFEVADVEALKAVYDTYEREAKRCLEAHLVFPAHDYNLKCSHLFNVLDTRGAIGVTERANYFRRMRNVAR